MQWLIANFPAIISVLSAVLGVVVLILHLAHQDAVAVKIQSIEDTIAKLDAPKA